MALILVVDDEPNLLALTSEGLMLEGFDVVTASGGIEALQVIRDKLPDLVVCDINMPDMDGYEVLASLRGDSLTTAIPFIFLSALSHPSEIREGMDKGADDYLVKPLDMNALLRAINSRLKRQANLEMARLRDYAHRLVIAQETERQNFARSLKDNLVDKLSDLKLSIEMLQRLSGNAQTITLQASSTLVSDTLNTINKLSYALWPSILSQLGLEAALLSLFDQLQENSKFHIDFEYDGLDKLNDPDLTIMLYRIIQEALVNTKQHAATNSASLKLWVEDDSLRLHIEDKGLGFDVQKALHSSNRIGLLSMLERSFLLNGELNIVSTPREGTSIYGRFPLFATKQFETAPISLAKKSVAPQFSQYKNHGEETDSSSAIRVAIAESTELSRWGYRAIIESDSRFGVISELSNWSMVLRFLEDVSVDILLISHHLAGENGGLVPLHQLHLNYPETRILLLSNYTEYTFASQALKNGVSGYLLKTSGSDELLEALSNLSQGKQYLSKEIMEAMQRNRATKPSKSMDAFSTLTEREREIFYRVVNGQSNQDIADELFISTRTVETHRLNMMRKLGISGMSALINFAVNKGLMGRSGDT